MTNIATKQTVNRDTTFVFDARPDAKRVYLAGDFNDWNPTAGRMTKRQGIFRKRVKLSRGQYQYKFVVDGQWHADPAARAEAPDGFGSSNSVIDIA